MPHKLTIGFIGGGNMAKAIAEGLLTKGSVNSSHIIISAPSEATTESWKYLSVETTHSNAKVINKADVIVFAIKPLQLDNALKEVRSDLENSLPSKLYVSLLAAVTCDVIYEKLKLYVQFDGRVIRVMPNTLAAIGEGCFAIAPHSSANSDDVQLIKNLFSSLGKCEVVPENLIPAITGLSGSGPAYIYLVIEALADGGVKQGLPRNLAKTFAAQTVLGAAKMVLETKKHPSQLKDEVCSAGGTTIYALHALEKCGLRAALMSAVEAAINRADDISKMNQN